MEERFNRYCANVDLLLLFLKVVAVHLDDKLSNHFQILLKLKDTKKFRRRGRHRFKFENLWVFEDRWREAIKDAWKDGV